MNHVTVHDSTHSFSPNFNSLGMKTCPECKGQQEGDEQPCSECSGDGEVFMDEQDRQDMRDNYLEDLRD